MAWLATVAVGLSSAAGVAGQEVSLTPQHSGTEVLLQAVSIVDDRVVWVSGHDGTFVTTVDGGDHWTAAVMDGGQTLEFRDVEAFGAQTAYLMSSGPGSLSRIYRTDDGGGEWTLQYQAEHPEAFLDCMAFWSPGRGLAYGDAVDGVPFLLQTSDGGVTWSRVPAEVLPPALEGEGGFAASGSCIRVAGTDVAHVAMGNGARSRLLTTLDGGTSWGVVDLPIVSGPGAGGTAVDVADDGFAIVVGGDIGDAAARVAGVALRASGGEAWTEGGRFSMVGPAYGGALIGSEGVVATGPGGLDYSSDRGRSWTTLDGRSWWAVEVATTGRGWAVGPGGRIIRLDLLR